MLVEADNSVRKPNLRERQKLESMGKPERSDDERDERFLVFEHYANNMSLLASESKKA